MFVKCGDGLWCVYLAIFYQRAKRVFEASLVYQLI